MILDGLVDTVGIEGGTSDRCVTAYLHRPLIHASVFDFIYFFTSVNSLEILHRICTTNRLEEIICDNGTLVGNPSIPALTARSVIRHSNNPFVAILRFLIESGLTFSTDFVSRKYSLLIFSIYK